MKAHTDDSRGEPLKGFRPAGFFALRTPLLSFDELLAWGEGLEVVPTAEDQAQLEESFVRDRQRLRDFLCQIVSRPMVREALFLASPELEQDVDLWLREPQSERGCRIERALARYFLRMAGRATPFGLFAGTSTGEVASETRLEIASRGECRRHTRLDMDYLDALAGELQRDQEIRAAALLYPNSSLHRAAGRVRYVETRLRDRKRSFHLVTADDDEYLSATLSRARQGARTSQLAAALVDEDISRAQADAYISELIDSQVLVPEFSLQLTGAEPIHSLISELGQSSSAQRVSECLSRTREELAALDGCGLGLGPERYREVTKGLAGLPAPIHLQMMFQVDLVKASPAARLGKAVVDEISGAVDVLHRLFGRYRSRADELVRFRDAFVARYELREVPLLEALDEEIGIGFPAGTAGKTQEAPLLKGLGLADAAEQSGETFWRPCDALLLRKLADALASNSAEIVLDASEVETSGLRELPALPDSFAVIASVAAANDAALAQGEFRVVLRSASGPSGAALLGRFCHADETLHAFVEQYLRDEELLKPEAIFAEIVHLPEGRLANVILRPVLRDYEITYLGRSGAPSDRQIPMSDLLVSVDGGRIRLRSARLGREVIPRLTSAHNYSSAQCGVYRFLGMLQVQGLRGWLGWDWGVPGATVPYLPRVVAGRVVLSPARWRLDREEIERLGEHDVWKQFQAVQKWRAERRLPRWVALAEGDNVLPIDLDNPLCVEVFLHLIRSRREAAVVEMLPGPDELCARGPEGRFVHELIVPFVRKPNEVPKTSSVSGNASRRAGPLRRFAPGSEWLYVKLYTGTSVADEILRDVVKPLAEAMIESGAVERWFFVRYGDPNWHLRLRFQGQPARLHSEVLPGLQEVVAPLLKDGRVWRLQLDTYEREIERYGGPEACELTEQLFHADSEAVLEILDVLEPGDAGLDERWRLTLCGMDRLLSDFGFDLQAKYDLLDRARDRMAKEFDVQAWNAQQINSRFRGERKNLEALLNIGEESDHPLRPGAEVLERRSRAWARAIVDLKERERCGSSSVPLAELAASHLHMHANRLLRSAHRAQEMVIYYFLRRLYASQLARGAKTREKREAKTLPIER